VYLGALLVGFFAAFTSYVAPLLALLPEIESETRGRARLSTLVGAANLLGLLAFTPLAFAGVDALRAGTGAEPVQAMRGVAVASGALALVLCALPIAAVDERRLAVRTGPSALGFGRAVRETLARPAFLIFAAGQVFLVLATHMAAPLPAYLATAVLGRSESFASLLSLVLLAAALGGFALVPRAAARLGARRALVCACLLAAPCLAAWGALRPVAPGAPSGALNLWIAFGSLAVLGIAVAGFAVLPYLLIGQLIDADRARTQTSRSAMFFGIQGLLLKWVYGAGSALLAYLFARYGNSAAQPGGVLVAGPIAALCCVAAAGGFALYPERDVLRRARSAPAE
jgi:Na+/melibiose symporter-like transporter